ncbi:MAG: 2-phospho-L-lactate transferase CofD family protein [Myxococcota bacterium]
MVDDASSGAVRPPRVVTLGGGHGQAALLAALCRVDCDITAIVSVADDGGCSGRLRKELGMPPPGDVRRCLTTLARNRRLAERFEVRLMSASDVASDAAPDVTRSAGNLALADAYHTFGSLQAAVDWAGELLQCRGRVVPVAEVPGVLAVYDMVAGALQGETTVASRAQAPVVTVVHGPEQANPAAVEAIGTADFVFMGPGSFITSTLATLTTAEVAEAIVETDATRIMMHNVASEGDQTERFTLLDYVRLLRDHLVIRSGEEDFDFAVLRHPGPEEPPRFARRTLGDGTVELVAPLCRAAENRHDTELVAAALGHHLGFRPRPPGSLVPPPTTDGDASFEASLARAQRRLFRTDGEATNG